MIAGKKYVPGKPGNNGVTIWTKPSIYRETLGRRETWRNSLKLVPSAVAKVMYPNSTITVFCKTGVVVSGKKYPATSAISTKINIR